MEEVAQHAGALVIALFAHLRLLVDLEEPVRYLGAFDLILWRFNARWKERKMTDVFLFLFGLIATILAVGPLVIAGINEQQSKRKK